jgi:beta-glucanase (GH16 family)
MSFKLFFASTFGLIKSTAKIEAAHNALLADFRMYKEFENSNELKEYLELELLVNSASFKQKKKELQGLSLKGSKEETQLKELKKLGKNSRLHKYYHTLKSEELKRFDQISASEMMTKYKELKTAVEKHSLSALKKMDKQTKEHVLYTEFLSLRDSSDLVFFRDFRKSSGYRNYELMLESLERKRFEELEKLTGSAEFKSRVAYLEDKNKWDKTEDATKEKRLMELNKLPQVINYQKYKNSNAFDFFKKWNLVFEDSFDSGKLDTQKWMTKSHWANETLGQNFSQVGDFHAFTDGRNISVEGKSLKIEVRKEKTKGMQWQIPFGFVEREFDYSSGIISTAGGEWWNHGILEAKVKYSSSSQMVDAIYLLGEESSPQINLVEIGAKNRVGTLTKKDGGIHSECAGISGLKAGEFYIFRLEWTSDSLKWKINDREILAISLSVPSHSMHLNIASILVSESAESLPHRFEIDWIRFYQRVNA